MANRAWQVNHIVEELQQSAQIDARATAPEQTSVDLRQVAERSLARARSRIEQRAAHIESSFEHRPILVRGDPLHLGRILDSLISNGLTYSIRPPRLKISVTVEASRAVVRVLDNGVGMSEIERVHAFEPFHRTKDPAFRDLPGTGLGLYVSAQLAAANNGTLVLETTEAGTGSAFALYLPLANAG